MPKLKVLFVDAHNSARGQIAEAYLNHYGKGYFLAESAGITKGTLNPIVVEVMKEEGIDISKAKPEAATEKVRTEYNFVISLCDKDIFSKAPHFPGQVKKIEWYFNDPCRLIGTYEENKAAIREIRNQIKVKILSWIKEAKEEEILI